MIQPILALSPNQVITGWDFSTGSVKCLAFDLSGNVIAESRFPTDIWTQNGVAELNLLQLEGQARATTRDIAYQLKELNRLKDWISGGISATHHTAGRIDARHNPIRRAICWNDQTLATYHAEGLTRLGGQTNVADLIGGPWAIRYSLSHLVKDEKTLSALDWQRTKYILPHGPLAAGYLTNQFGVISVSSAASTGMMDLRTNQWSRGMLNALANQQHRDLVWTQLPKIIPYHQQIGVLSESLAIEAHLDANHRPVIYPTLDDQAAGLAGGGAVDAGQLAIILGNSAVVNSSSDSPPNGGNLDAMKLNWGPYLWMRCYSNGAQFLDKILGENPKWDELEYAANQITPTCNGTGILPFVLSEPSLNIHQSKMEWYPNEPQDMGIRYRASLEALAYLIALGVKAHIQAGQKISQITVSGGIARSQLMCQILADVLQFPLHRLVSNEGTALGAAVMALAGCETNGRKKMGINEEFSVADSVKHLVRFKDIISPNPNNREIYLKGMNTFIQIAGIQK